MPKTYSQQLEEVQAAIARVMSDGQAWTQGERSQTEARLAELNAEEVRLRALVDRETRGGIRVRRAVVID